MRRYFIPHFSLLLLAFSGITWAQGTPFTETVKIRFSKSGTDRRLVDKDATLIFDDSEHKLIIKNQEHPLYVSFGDVQKVVFDVSTRMRGGAMSQMVGGLAGAAIASKHVNHYWCYLEYKAADGAALPYMVEVPKDSSEKVIEKMKSVFGDKVTVSDFAE